VQISVWPSWYRCHSLSLASVKSRLVLPFWYRLTWVFPDKGQLNGCVCVYGDSVDNTALRTSVSSSWSECACCRQQGHAGSLHRQNPPVLNCMMANLHVLLTCIMAVKPCIQDCFKKKNYKTVTATTTVLLQPTRNRASLRIRGHSYQLPEYSTDLHKKSFLIRSLYSFVKWNSFFGFAALYCTSFWLLLFVCCL